MFYTKCVCSVAESRLPINWLLSELQMQSNAVNRAGRLARDPFNRKQIRRKARQILEEQEKQAAAEQEQKIPDRWPDADDEFHRNVQQPYHDGRFKLHGRRSRRMLRNLHRRVARNRVSSPAANPAHEENKNVEDIDIMRQRENNVQEASRDELQDRHFMPYFESPISVDSGGMRYDEFLRRLVHEPHDARLESVAPRIPEYTVPQVESVRTQFQRCRNDQHNTLIQVMEMMQKLSEMLPDPKKLHTSRPANPPKILNMETVKSESLYTT